MSVGTNIVVKWTDRQVEDATKQGWANWARLGGREGDGCV